MRSVGLENILREFITLLREDGEKINIRKTGKMGREGKLLLLLLFLSSEGLSLTFLVSKPSKEIQWCTEFLKTMTFACRWQGTVNCCPLGSDLIWCQTVDKLTIG